MTSPYARTLLQIADDTLRLCNDFVSSGSSGRTYTFAEAVERINDVVLEMTVKNEMLKSSTTIQVVEEQNVYSFPEGFLRLLRLVLHDAEGLETYVILPRAADTVVLTGRIMDGQGQPTEMFRDNLRFDEIGVWAIPDTTGSAVNTESNLVARYVRKPVKMTNNGDFPDTDVPPWIHKDIKYGAAALLLKASRKASLRKKGAFFELYWNMEVMGKYRKHFARSTIGRMTQVG
jgi:hypothetical protein